LLRERGEILLTRLQSGCVFTSGTLKVHPEPNRPNHYTDNASGDVLGNLHALFVSKLFSPGVIGLYFRPDHRAVGIRILRLHAGDGRGIAARASR
jgi:hypothetical protein